MMIVKHLVSIFGLVIKLIYMKSEVGSDLLSIDIIIGSRAMPDYPNNVAVTMWSNMYIQDLRLVKKSVYNGSFIPANIFLDDTCFQNVKLINHVKIMVYVMIMVQQHLIHVIVKVLILVVRIVINLPINILYQHHRKYNSDQTCFNTIKCNTGR